VYYVGMSDRMKKGRGTKRWQAMRLQPVQKKRGVKKIKKKKKIKKV